MLPYWAHGLPPPPTCDTLCCPQLYCPPACPLLGWWQCPGAPAVDLSTSCMAQGTTRSIQVTPSLQHSHQPPITKLSRPQEFRLCPEEALHQFILYKNVSELLTEKEPLHPVSTKSLTSVNQTSCPSAIEVRAGTPWASLTGCSLPVPEHTQTLSARGGCRVLSETWCGLLVPAAISEPHVMLAAVACLPSCLQQPPRRQIWLHSCTSP